MFGFTISKKNLFLLLIALVLAFRMGNRIYYQWGGKEYIEQLQTKYLTPSSVKKNDAVVLSNTSEMQTPEEVVEAYLQAMGDGNSDPNLPIYTDESQAMMRSWQVSKRQMKAIHVTYQKCSIDAVKIRPNYAVVRYLIDHRTCSPFFLQRENEGWKLDLTVMMKGIRFNSEDVWSLSRANLNSNYKFAFSDWRFDQNGYPQK